MQAKNKDKNLAKPKKNHQRIVFLIKPSAGYKNTNTRATDSGKI